MNEIKINEKVIFSSISQECTEKIIDLLFEDTKNEFNVRGYHDGYFHSIECMENEEEYGFFKSEADRRPSSATYIKKDEAERLYLLFHKFV